MLTAHLLACLTVCDGFAVSHIARLQPIIAVAINLALSASAAVAPLGVHAEAYAEPRSQALFSSKKGTLSFLFDNYYLIMV